MNLVEAEDIDHCEMVLKEDWGLLVSYGNSVEEFCCY